MKLKLIVFFAAGVIAMGLLLGASAAQAATVTVVDGNATRIDNLDVFYSMGDRWLRPSLTDLFEDIKHYPVSSVSNCMHAGRYTQIAGLPDFRCHCCRRRQVYARLFRFGALCAGKRVKHPGCLAA